jgi:protein-tyrosine phosphatase
VDRALGGLRRGGLVPVIAHPERYRCLWRAPDVLERLLDVGAAALLDSAALVGKYGREPQRCAEELLERGLYHAACSDAHRPGDIEPVAAGMRRIAELYGDDEVEFLFREGPAALLEGQIPE